jgi:uncharacterized protein (TIGR02271 family)
LYDTRAEAEAARQRLSAAVDVERVKILDKQGDQSGRSLGNLSMSHDDRHAYGEGIRRGGFLLCAEVDSGEDAGEIIRILEESSSVDLDERQESWRSEGWAPYAATGTGTGTGTGNGSGTMATGGSSSMSAGSGMGSQPAMQSQTGGSATGSVVQEEHIPIVEEELRVGKREVERGGARVRSYVREVPVHEQVTLREEHVNVERRPVDQAVSSADAAGLMQDRSIEMRETAEEAVVQKVAQVREEVVVSKTVEERVEQIDDTVRRTEVEVDEGSDKRSAFGSFGGDASRPDTTSELDFERDGNRR